MNDSKQHSSEQLQSIKVEIVKPQQSGEIASIATTQSSLESKKQPKEINGPRGLEPTRYGDWESKGRCYDF